jgi:hypothetical protein
MFKVPEEYRMKSLTGMFKSTEADGNNGYFIIPFESFELLVVASDGLDWEHVSVSLRNRTPNWREMCFIKDLFWSKDDCVLQYYPAESEYVNNHELAPHQYALIAKTSVLDSPYARPSTPSMDRIRSKIV